LTQKQNGITIRIGQLRKIAEIFQLLLLDALHDYEYLCFRTFGDYPSATNASAHTPLNEDSDPYRKSTRKPTVKTVG
jgi:hypothetical protein